jgi:hypothetical protein
MWIKLKKMVLVGGQKKIESGERVIDKCQLNFLGPSSAPHISALVRNGSRESFQVPSITPRTNPDRTLRASRSGTPPPLNQNSGDGAVWANCSVWTPLHNQTAPDGTIYINRSVRNRPNEGPTKNTLLCNRRLTSKTTACKPGVKKRVATIPRQESLHPGGPTPQKKEGSATWKLRVPSDPPTKRVWGGPMGGKSHRWTSKKLSFRISCECCPTAPRLPRL